MVVQQDNWGMIRHNELRRTSRASVGEIVRGRDLAEVPARESWKDVNIRACKKVNPERTFPAPWQWVE